MYSRVLTFTGAENIDEGVAYLRDKVVPFITKQPGYRGVSASADRSGGVFGILSLWETEADREASFGPLTNARQEALGIVGGDLKVETFEQVVLEINQPPKVGSALLVTRVSMDPAKVDENLSFFQSEVVPRIKANAGFLALRNMINRQTGEGMVGTVWEDEGAMKVAADEALARRQEGVARGVTFGDTSQREILFSDVR
jgi:heme-degrading monooxygenase HmoA